MNPPNFPEAQESGDSCAVGTPREARSRLDPRMAPLHWTSQELTKVATAAQLAAPGEAKEEAERITGGGRKE